MKCNKKLLVSAVGASLALSAGVSQAYYTSAFYSMFFPYVVKDANRTTVVTLIGFGQPVNSGPELHLQYWTKSTTAANTAACEPSSTTMTFTDNDTVTFDTAGLLGYPLFGDTTNLAPLGASISYAAPRHGYLYVSGVNNNASLEAGYWMELDLANGGAHGDWAFGSYAVNGNLFAEENDPWNILMNSWVGNIEYAAPVSFWPASVASTVFTVTPVGTSMETSDNNSVVIQVHNSNHVQGAYDRNENGVDGTVPQTVRCVGRLTAAQLMPGVVANAAWAATGGWGWLTNLGDGDAVSGEASIDLDAVVYQVDSSSAAGAGKFMSNATRISTWQGYSY